MGNAGLGLAPSLVGLGPSTLVRSLEISETLAAPLGQVMIRTGG
jgi:hypothetical protein